MDILQLVLDVFGKVGEWMVGIIPTFFSLFYTPGIDGAAGSLTILGVLAIVTLGIGLATMFIAMIRSFFKGRG